MFKVENEIWSRIQKGDIAAFEELYDGFAGAMFSLSLEILSDRWEAEEVIQDIFSFLWKNRMHIPPKKESSAAGYWYYRNSRSYPLRMLRILHQPLELLVISEKA